MAASRQALANVAEYTVSELSASLKRTVEDVYGHVRLRGEISGFRGPHSSGHCYFALKDERARIDAVCWRGTYPRVRQNLVEGLEVVATGRLTTFPGRSSYQIVVETLEPAGMGALMALLEERKRKLAAEGLFDEARKRPIPYLPGVIGVVTSPTGAVIRDILHRLADRFPSRVVVWPVRVQGESSGEEVAAAIRGLNALEPGGAVPRPDTIIVARGGGSLEDLWGFNDEAVVRAAAESAVPLISAVGHETDWTLIDHAADMRCPTPSAAAECAVPVRAELLANVGDLGARQSGAVLRRLDRLKSELRAAMRALGRREDLLAMPRQRLDEAGARLARSLDAVTARRRVRFDAASARLTPRLLEREAAGRRQAVAIAASRAQRAFDVAMTARRRDRAGIAARLRPDALRREMRVKAEILGRAGARLDTRFEAETKRHVLRLANALKLFASLNYRSVLARGYALVRDEAGLPVRRAGDVAPGARLDIELAEGRVSAVAEGDAARPRRRAAPAPRQASLFEE